MIIEINLERKLHLVGPY